MKIAFLSFYSGRVYRGVEVFVHELGNRLTALGHEIVVYQGGEKLPQTRYRVEKLKTLHFLPALEKDLDILAPLNGDIQVWLAKIWCVLNKKKLVVMGQAGPGLGDRIKILAFPDVFISLSDFQTGWCRRGNPFIRVEKIPNGVDLAKFRPGKSRPNFGLKRPIILSVGALEPMKRPDLIIKAAAKLDASLLLVGRGKLEAPLAALGQKLMPGRLAIKALTFEEMPAVYQAADLFAFATVPWEAFGIVILEALAANLPVVVPDDPIRREIIGDAGLVAEVTDSEAFAQKINEALNKNWGNLPRRRAEEFSWDKIAQKYDQVFRHLAGV
jgi:glycosyltransferase involved in cell wall biosynthesis